MTKQHEPAPASEPSTGLEAISRPAGDAGLSLDELSAAFAEMLNTGEDPYAGEDGDETEAGDVAGATTTQPASGPTDVSPLSILEALLFVGDPKNQPISGQQVAGLMRGVRPAEIDALVRELNSQYAARRCPYFIASTGPGYQFTLRPEHHRVREKFYGRARQARLSQAAIEVLAAVAYHQPLSADEVNDLRGTPSGAILTQMVRRQLLRVERPEHKVPGKYFTTSRFLDLFGLSSLDDLPRSQNLEPQ